MRNATGRIDKVTSRQAGDSWSYGYDDLDRLLSAANGTTTPGAQACDVGAGTLPTSQTFTYDSVGNMLSNSLVGAYAYPTGGAGVVRPHAVSSAGGQTYGYDANGNMTNVAGDTLTYDGENRLTSAPGVTFVYGADGNRLKKIAGGTTTLFLGADVEKTGSQYTKYLPGDALRQASTTYWLLRDHLNSVRLITGSTGSVVESGQYRPYGERLGFSGPVAQSRGYIGERHDDETGLMYLNARYYDPVLARFIQADPAHPILPGVGVNRYAYVGNDPINHLDRSGRWALIDDAIAIGGGALLGVAAQGVVDLVTWELSSWETYVAAGAGGAAGGETLLYTANPIAAGAVGGFVYSATDQLLTTGSISPERLLVETAVGAITAGVGAKILPPVASAIGSGLKSTTTFVAGIFNVGAEKVAFPLVTRVDLPSGLVPGGTDFGNAMHETIAKWLAAQFGPDAFKFAVLRGQKGIDVRVLDDRVAEILGAKHIEIKPLTEDQVRRAMDQNADNWLLPEFKIWGYTEAGGVYDLGIYQLLDDAALGSIRPGTPLN